MLEDGWCGCDPKRETIISKKAPTCINCNVCLRVISEQHLLVCVCQVEPGEDLTTVLREVKIILDSWQEECVLFCCSTDGELVIPADLDQAVLL